MSSIQALHPPDPRSAQSMGASRQAAHLRLALNGLPMGLLTFDHKLRILFATDRLASLMDADPVVIRRCASLLDLLDACGTLDAKAAQQVHEACLAAVTGSCATDVPLAISAVASRRDFVVRICRIGDAQWMASFDEVTERRAAEASALATAMRDTLTGLPTRKVFHDRTSAALEVSPGVESALVMLVDLDRFKAVNDTLGHPIGDALLRLVAKRFGTVLGQQDVVARLGGDEFGVLIAPAPDAEGAAKLAKRMIDVIGART